jgi:hypothetical protein
MTDHPTPARGAIERLTEFAASDPDNQWNRLVNRADVRALLSINAALVEVASDLERRADSCKRIADQSTYMRDIERIKGKQAAYRHAAVLIRAALNLARSA